MTNLWNNTVRVSFSLDLNTRVLFFRAFAQRKFSRKIKGTVIVGVIHLSPFQTLILNTFDATKVDTSDYKLLTSG